MGLDDGWGDETPEQTALRFEHWAHDRAGRMVAPSSQIYDDLVQEALIAAWRTAAEKGIRNATYITKAARHRMLDVVTGKQMTGGDPTPGPRYRPKEVVLDWQEISAEPGPMDALLEAADLLGAVEWAYHRGEIGAALSALSPTHRAYVVERFWYGKRDMEIAAEWGVDRRLLNTWWRRTIRPALAESLRHLAEV
jgi:DNA-directed RNA polymerase specialized sigma24 family protein